MSSTISNPDLSVAFSLVSDTIDKLPPQQVELFLAKLVLLLCQHVDTTSLAQAVASAAADVECSA
ncbi:MAG: hypothetical protein J0H09_02875 [Burkholderiales bacterium]|nr:hypothetical protein [Burkholderiales bacterium]ODU67939.1 MAG: hypothetical protein ABT05_03180 [Lautropia sp. SCN 66-9]